MSGPLLQLCGRETVIFFKCVALVRGVDWVPRFHHLAPAIASIRI
jgi:hypothetical protein